MFDVYREPRIQQFVQLYKNKIKNQSEAQYLRPSVKLTTFGSPKEAMLKEEHTVDFMVDYIFRRLWTR